MPLAKFRIFLPWFRVLLGIAVLTGEALWIHRTGLWVGVSVGGETVVLAGLRGLGRWLLPFLLFSFCVLIHKRRAPQPSSPEDAFFRWKPVAAHLTGCAICALVTLQLVKPQSAATGTTFLAA